jgi:hypothetical protein
MHFGAGSQRLGLLRICRHHAPSPLALSERYEEALAAGKGKSVKSQPLLITEMSADNAAGFAATLGARDPSLTIARIVCPKLSAGACVLDTTAISIANSVSAVGARAVTQLRLGSPKVIPAQYALRCALPSGRRGAHARDVGSYAQ